MLQQIMTGLRSDIIEYLKPKNFIEAFQTLHSKVSTVQLVLKLRRAMKVFSETLTE